MNGKRLDVTLLLSFYVIFFAVAMIHPGVTNLVIALVGGLLLGYYNSLVRHDPKTDALREPWRRPGPDLHSSPPGRKVGRSRL